MKGKKYFYDKINNIEKKPVKDLTFGEKIVLLRINKNLSQVQLAEMIGIGESTINYYENDERRPGFDVLLQFAKVLDVSADYLLGLTDIENSDYNIREICKKTGLSEKAINNIKKAFSLELSLQSQQAAYPKAHKYKFILNTLLENDFFARFVFEAETLSRKFTSLRDKYPSEKEYQEIKDKNVKDTEPFNYNVFRVQEILKNLIINTIENQYSANLPNTDLEVFLKNNHPFYIEKKVDKKPTFEEWQKEQVLLDKKIKKDGDSDA